MRFTHITLLRTAIQEIWPLTEDFRKSLYPPSTPEDEIKYRLYSLETAQRINTPLEKIHEHLFRLIQLLQDPGVKKISREHEKILAEVKCVYLSVYPDCDGIPLSHIRPQQLRRFILGESTPDKPDLYSRVLDLLTETEGRDDFYAKKAANNDAKRALFRLLDYLVKFRMPEKDVVEVLQLLILTCEDDSEAKQRFGEFYNTEMHHLLKENNYPSIDLSKPLDEKRKSLENLDAEIDRISKSMSFKLLYKIVRYDHHLSKGNEKRMSFYYFDELGKTALKDNPEKRNGMRDLFFSVVNEASRAELLDCLHRFVLANKDNSEGLNLFSEFYSQELFDESKRTLNRREGKINFSSRENCAKLTNEFKIFLIKTVLDEARNSTQYQKLFTLDFKSAEKLVAQNATPDSSSHWLQLQYLASINASLSSYKKVFQLMIGKLNKIPELQDLVNLLGIDGTIEQAVVEPTVSEISTLMKQLKFTKKNWQEFINLQLSIWHGSVTHCLTNLAEFVKINNLELQKSNADWFKSATDLLAKNGLLFANGRFYPVSPAIRVTVNKGCIAGVKLSEPKVEINAEFIDKHFDQLISSFSKLFGENGLASISFSDTTEELQLEDSGKVVNVRQVDFSYSYNSNNIIFMRLARTQTPAGEKNTKILLTLDALPSTVRHTLIMILNDVLGSSLSKNSIAPACDFIQLTHPDFKLQQNSVSSPALKRTLGRSSGVTLFRGSRTSNADTTQPPKVEAEPQQIEVKKPATPTLPPPSLATPPTLPESRQQQNKIMMK